VDSAVLQLEDIGPSYSPVKGWTSPCLPSRAPWRSEPWPPVQLAEMLGASIEPQPPAPVLAPADTDDRCLAMVSAAH
jgi:hypothetical protein